MSTRPQIEAVTPALLPAFAEFLHQHLDSSRSASAWMQALQTCWLPEPPPNHGFVLLKDGAIVGGIGALYAERKIDGRLSRSCNITSWCVLDGYRAQSMRLAMALMAQPGVYWYNDFSPTQVVAGTLQFLKFKPLPDGQWVLPNLPLPGGGELLSEPTAIAAALQGSALRDYEQHRDFPWLEHVLVGHPGAWCHVIYKRRRFKGLGSALVLHASHPERLAAHWKRLSRHWLFCGLPLAQVPRRLSADAPMGLARLRSGFNPLLYRSDDLTVAQVDVLYSEQMALDL